MENKREVFQKHYEDYLEKIAERDLKEIQQQLDIAMKDQCLHVPFFNQIYSVGKKGISNSLNQRPHYGICVILAQYILRFPQTPVQQRLGWVNFKDFRKASTFNNENILRTDCEEVIINQFTDNLEELDLACQQLGGWIPEVDLSYDRVFQFEALPTISLLLLMNDQDDMFPAECRVLYQAHAEDYLDPESLALTGVSLALHLKRSEETTI